MDLPKLSCRKEETTYSEQLAAGKHSLMAGQFLVRQGAPMILMFDQWQTRYCFSMKENNGGRPFIEPYILVPHFPKQRTYVDSYNCPLVFKFLAVRGTITSDQVKSHILMNN